MARGGQRHQGQILRWKSQSRAKLGAAPTNGRRRGQLFTLFAARQGSSPLPAVDAQDRTVPRGLGIGKKPLWCVEWISFYLPGTRTDKREKNNLTASPEWKLVKFPEGYTLWLHKSGVETDPANPRLDAYLYGAPHLGPTASRTPSAPPAPTVFRSPMEFVEHAIWLMRRGAGQCHCKYCHPGQNQLDIILRLDRGKVEDDEDGDVIVIDVDDGAAAGSGSGGSSSGPFAAASRGRGAGTRGRRGRRARRDRSPPIMAKDYRVGNTSSGPPRPASA